MDEIPQLPVHCSNFLLSRLSDPDYQSMLPHLELIETPLHFVLCERDEPVQYAYFPLSGGHSIQATMVNGAKVEVGIVGFEGFSTVDLILDSEFTTETTVCQIPGTALRMPADVFKHLTVSGTQLRHLCLLYPKAYLTMVSQLVVCNTLHTLGNRLARWMLQSHDRAQQNEFLLTQQYLAAMLGTHRPTVSNNAGMLQRAGIIEYHRGKIHILDRLRLEGASCECYWIIRSHFERILGTTF
jgi:CRP-like cAMP-binding protein